MTLEEFFKQDDPYLASPHFIRAEHNGCYGDNIFFRLIVACNYLCDVEYRPDECVIVERGGNKMAYGDSFRPDADLIETVKKIKQDIIHYNSHEKSYT